MPDSLLFGAASRIRLTAGSYVGTAAYTMAIILKQTGAFSEQFLMSNDDATWLIELTAGGNFGAYDGSTLRTSTNTTFDTDGWQLFAATKASGTQTPRMHSYTWDTTTWVHEAGSGTLNNNPAVHVNGWDFSADAAVAASFIGNILIAGLWDSVLSDAEIETLITNKPAWVTAAPKEAFRMDANAVTTLTPFVGTSTETLRAGSITLDAGDAPTGWLDTEAPTVDVTTRRFLVRHSRMTSW